jgi:hypothetical protein
MLPIRSEMYANLTKQKTDESKVVMTTFYFRLKQNSDDNINDWTWLSIIHNYGSEVRD